MSVASFLIGFGIGVVFTLFVLWVLAMRAWP